MTSLADAYGSAGRSAPSRRRKLAGAVLFLFGATSLVSAIGLATTNIGAWAGLTGYAAREVAGVIAGLGLPAVILGIFAVLPSSQRTQLIAVLGTSVALVGVASFPVLYPSTWLSSAPVQTLGVSLVYILGVLTMFWCLFGALAAFETRNSPGGTARMKVTEQGRIRLIEDSSLPGLGGIGLFGGEPDGTVPTQTNRDVATDGSSMSGTPARTDPTTQQPAHRSNQRTQANSQQTSTPTQTGPTEHELDPSLASAGPETSATTDGGTAATSRDPITETAVQRGEPDNYCGNCRHFQYVMNDGDIEPYCSFHEHLLDDMEACSAWVEE
jgi:cytochrome c biogenesis protein CcdA